MGHSGPTIILLNVGGCGFPDGSDAAFKVRLFCTSFLESELGETKCIKKMPIFKVKNKKQLKKNPCGLGHAFLSERVQKEPAKGLR